MNKNSPNFGIHEQSKVFWVMRQSLTKSVSSSFRFISNEDKRAMLMGAKRDNELLIQVFKSFFDSSLRLIVV